MSCLTNVFGTKNIREMETILFHQYFLKMSAVHLRGTKIKLIKALDNPEFHFILGLGEKSKHFVEIDRTKERRSMLKF